MASPSVQQRGRPSRGRRPAPPRPRARPGRRPPRGGRPPGARCPGPASRAVARRRPRRRWRWAAMERWRRARASSRRSPACRARATLSSSSRRSSASPLTVARRPAQLRARARDRAGRRGAAGSRAWRSQARPSLLGPVQVPEAPQGPREAQLGPAVALRPAHSSAARKLSCSRAIRSQPAHLVVADQAGRRPLRPGGGPGQVAVARRPPPRRLRQALGGELRAPSPAGGSARSPAAGLRLGQHQRLVHQAGQQVEHLAAAPPGPAGAPTASAASSDSPRRRRPGGAAGPAPPAPAGW